MTVAPTATPSATSRPQARPDIEPTPKGNFEKGLLAVFIVVPLLAVVAAVPFAWGWADTLALYYSQLYRSAYVFSYFLSAVAVFIALGTVFIHDDPQALARDVLGTKAVFVGCELVVIGAIMLIVWLGLNRRWQ